MFPRNSATPPRIAIGAVIQISDGAVQSAGVSVVVRAEGGSETAGGGTVSYGASSNIVYYAPTQAETNHAAFAVVAYKTGCLPVSQTVVTSRSDVAGHAGLDWGQVLNKTTTHDFTATTIATSQQVDVNTIKTQSVTAGAGVTFPSSIASPTNITAATGIVLSGVTHTGAVIPTVSTVTNQLTAADVSAGVWRNTVAADFTVALSVGKSVMNGVTLGTGLTTAAVSGAVGSVTGAVGSVTGNVGGNVVGSVGSLTGHTPQTGDSFARIGATGSGLTTLASAANLATVAGYIDTEIGDLQSRLPAALVGGRIDASAGALAANVITAASMAADASAEIADQVWDELLSGHAGVGSTGEALSAAGASGDPWITALPGAYGSGTAGKIIGDNLNATVSSRASQTTLDALDDYVDTEVSAILATTIKLDTTLIPAAGSPGEYQFTSDSLELAPTGSGGGGLDAAGVRTAIGLASANLDTQLSGVLADIAVVDGVVDSILVDTAEIGAAGAGLTAVASATNLAVAVGYIDTEIGTLLSGVSDLQGRVPAALTGAGNMKSDVLAISGSTESADRLERTTLAIVTGTVDTGSNTTSIVTSALSPVGGDSDQFKGRILIFDKDTTTAGLRGQATDITGVTAASLPVITVTALTQAPAVTDTFTIT